MKISMNKGIRIGLILLIVLFSNILKAQTNNGELVRGKIIEKSTNEVLVMVTVAEIDPSGRVVGGVSSNMDGEYAIKIKNSRNSLKVTYIGYASQTKLIGNNRIINFSLTDDQRVLAEAVVTAKQMSNSNGLPIPKREISTAVQTISTKEFEGLQVTSIDDALQGRIAGLDIVSNSGEPGSGMSMKIRGTATITGNSQPLIVVNGVPYEANVTTGFDFANATDEQFANLISVNPEDILEISVYKDAASTAVWGAKGANGVLDIKTKKGSTGKTRLSYIYRGTFSKQPQGLNLLNGDDYTMLMKQAYYNVALNPNATSSIPEFNYVGIDGFSEYENYNNNTDWVKSVTQTAWINSHNVAVEGGGERAKYRLSTEYLNQPGTVIGQMYNRLSSRLNLSYDVSNRIKFLTEVGFTYGDNDKNYIDDNNKSSILDMAYRKMPNLSVFAQDRYGDDTDIYYNVLQSSNLNSGQKNLLNPVGLANLATYNEKNYRATPNFRFEYDLLDPEISTLKLTSQISFDINNLKTSKFLPREVSSYQWNNANVGRAESIDSKSFQIQTENRVLWVPKFGNENQNLTTSLFMRSSSVTSEAQRIIKLGLRKITDASAEGYPSTITSTENQYRTMTLGGQIHYAFKSRYIIDLSVTRDGSSRFGKGRQWGIFYGISGKWIASDEHFWDPIRNIINEFGLRPSYGVTGNPVGKDYLAYSRYAYYNVGYLGNLSSFPSNIQLTKLKWEPTSEINIGADIHFFNNQLIAELNYYKRRTRDLIMPDLTIPSSSGFSKLTYQNVGIMDNTGWELYLSANNIIHTKNFRVSLNLNFANSVNKVIDLSESALSALNPDFGGSNGEYLTRVQLNNSYGSIYGFRSKGVYQYSEYDASQGHTNAPVAKDENGNVIYGVDGAPKPIIYNANSVGYQFKGGDAIYEDINHDGAIDELDIVYLGNSNPKLVGGFGGNFSYKNFSCTMFFNFRYGFDIINSARMNAENMYTNDNQSIAVNWRWRKNGDVTTIPRAVYNTAYNWLGSDRFVEDGSFLRFKYLTFAYEVPNKVLRPFGLKQLTTSVTFNNLYCFTKYTGVDPEISPKTFKAGNLFGVVVDESKTPRAKDFTINFKIGF